MSLDVCMMVNDNVGLLGILTVKSENNNILGATEAPPN